MAATTAYTLLYIKTGRQASEKMGIDVQTGDTSSMAVEQHQPRKAVEPKNEGPFPTLLQATTATPGWVVVTSAIAIRIL